MYTRSPVLNACVAWGLARSIYLVVFTTQPSLENYNMVYSVHACTKPEPIMFLKLPIMLLSNAPNFSLLCPNYAPYAT